MEELIQIINSFERLDLETELAIRKSFVEETFKKSELIIEEDKICDKIYFIKMGAVRRFCISIQVKFHLYFFFLALGPFFSRFIKQVPASV
ncbi:hypothetical protein [Flavobacterium nitrogenifigens]|uniref:hypothetical protein n=1 Tax=Flavobacterium nitrogenifigens TaxID=1617283 RepID=UPI0011EE29B1|nr:hypothetical protein [Flavobacterium nitrogenifigens]